MNIKTEKLKVLFVAAELTPLAKVGGLADVIGALPKVLNQLNVDVRIVIPKYSIIDSKKYKPQLIKRGIKIKFDNRQETFDLYQTILPHSSVIIYLIDQKKYLGHGGVYPSPDASSSGTASEAHRFIFFSLAVLNIFKPLHWQPDILHCHDWHVGLVPALIKLFKLKISTLLTIHNLAYQGVYQKKVVAKLLNNKFNLNNLTSPRTKPVINCLEQGILHADLINTVSPTYAKEILTKEFGCGLEKDLQIKKSKLSGILNGLDLDHFNPWTDPDIKYNYSPDDLTGKFKNKKVLQKVCSFKNKNLPIIGLVSRLAEQKGFDLIIKIVENLLKHPCQIVLLGTGDHYYEKFFKKLAKKYKNLNAKIGFDAKFAQQIYAGSDLFLMPSRFEPCGLGQMIAMSYGTLPIVRATGGLKDTVKHLRNGFVFKKYNKEELLKSCLIAIKNFRQKNKHLQMVKNAMSQNFSWDKSARKYIKLYNKLS